MENDKIKRYEPAPQPIERLRATAPGRSATVEMQESGGVVTYWRMLRKRRWTVVAVVAALAGVVLAGTLKEKKIYSADALLEIEKENPNILTVQELFEVESVSDTYLETEYKILQSDALARRVIGELRLDLLPEFGRKAGAAAASTAENFGAPPPPDPATVEIALAIFRKRLTVDPVKRSRLVEISFESEDPRLAARVVNALAESDIEENLQVRWDATQKASEWLTAQLEGLKARLEKSETQLQEYARRNGLVYLETAQGAPENIVNERLRDLQEELTRAQAARYEKESLYRLVQAGNLDALPAIASDKVVGDLTEQLADIERQKAQLETTFTGDYPLVKSMQNQIDRIDSLIAEERQRVAHELTDQYQAAVRREALVQQAYEDQQHQADQVAARAVQYNILKREADTNKQLYDGLLSRLKEAGVSAGLKASNIRVVDAAVAPTKPARPNLPLNLALAAVVGLVLGVGAAFAQEHLDNSLKSSEDVERFLGLPALGMIPAADSLHGRRKNVYGLPEPAEQSAAEAAEAQPQNGAGHWYRIAGGAKPPAALAEAFRGLRTSVLLSTADRPPRTLLVSSSQPGEGKTTISINLSISLSQLGRRVLLIDGDMRRPSVRKALQVPNGLGLVSYLTGQQDWRAAVQPSGMENLDVLVCGPVPPNPVELLSGERMRALLDEAKQEYDFVLVDSPPLLNVSDSRVLAVLVEGMVLVVRGGVTPRELARRARAYASDVGANVIGVVLNNLDIRRGDEYGRYYGYDYYSAEDAAHEESKA